MKILASLLSLLMILTGVALPMSGCDDSEPRVNVRGSGTSSSSSKAKKKKKKKTTGTQDTAGPLADIDQSKLPQKLRNVDLSLIHI